MLFTEEDKKRLRAGVFSAAIIIAIFLYFNFSLVKSWNKITQGKIEKLNTENATLSMQLGEYRKMVKRKGKIEEMQRYVQSVSQRLPKAPEQTKFLYQFIKMTETTGYKNKSVKAERVITTSHYTEIPYKIEGYARYHDIGQFLNIAEINPERFMRISGFTIENFEKHPSQHNVRLTLSTFMFNTP